MANIEVLWRKIFRGPSVLIKNYLFIMAALALLQIGSTFSTGTLHFGKGVQWAQSITTAKKVTSD